MAITTLAGYEAARKQVMDLWYDGNITTTAGQYGSGWRGTLLAASLTSGFVPTGNTDAGGTWGGLGDNKLLPAPAGQSLYLTKAKVSNGRGSATSFPYAKLALFDMLYKAGTYNFNVNQTLSGQPSYASRLPDGDYAETELWIEWVTATTGNPTVTITYTNQSGTPAKTTSIVYGSTAPIRRMDRFPLASGDTGVQKIESVVGTVATAGTFNILVLRRLAFSTMGGGDQATHYGNNCTRNQGILHLGMPQIFDNTCFTIAAAGTSTSTGTFGWEIEVASG